MNPTRLLIRANLINILHTRAPVPQYLAAEIYRPPVTWSALTLDVLCQRMTVEGLRMDAQQFACLVDAVPAILCDFGALTYHRLPPSLD